MVSLLSVASLAAASGDLRLLEAVQNGDSDAIRSLLKERADVNAPQPDGATALAWAVHRDDLETVDLLIRAGANVNAANDYGITPLSLACSNRNSAMVERLLKAGANPNIALWTGETPVMTAARTGNGEAVNSLLNHGADVNARETRRGQTALMWAIAEGHPEVAKILIEHKADIHAKSHVLAADGFQPKVYTTYDGDLRVSSNGGFTPLLFAAQAGDLETTKLLVAAGADVNEATDEEGSALVLASSYGHEQLALYLLEHGANPNAAAGDGSGITALHYALRDGLKALMAGKGAGLFTQKVQQEQQSATKKAEAAGPLPGSDMSELMKALLARGADVNASLKAAPARFRKGGRAYVSLAGATPFLLAAASGNIPAMRFLVEGRANTKLSTVVDEKAVPVGVYSDNAQFQGGTSPLLAAAGLGRARDRRGEEARKALETARMLVDLGADVNQANEAGWTPLHAAAYIGADPIIEFLVEKGAKLDVRNGCGQTPFSLADGSSARGLIQIPTGRKSTTALLKKLGAGATPLAGPVGRCVEGRYGIDYFTERDKDKKQQ
jgi:ankyrin repeat protein